MDQRWCRLLGACVLLAVVPACTSESKSVAPEVTVSPRVDLVDNQVVSVSGRHFAPNAYLQIDQCEADGDCFTTSTAARASDDGTFEAEVGVISREVDCRAERDACVIRVSEFPSAGGIGHPRATVGLHFDPDEPLAPSPTVEIDPAGELIDGQEVVLRGSNFRLGAAPVVVQCAASGSFSMMRCGVPNGGLAVDDYADASGDLMIDFRVRALLQLPEGEVIDCRAEPCVLALDEGSFADPLTVPIVMDAEAPPAPQMELTAESLGNGRIAVEGREFFPNEDVVLELCPADWGTDYWRCGWTGAEIAADADGRLMETVEIDPAIEGDDPYDCRPDRCVLVIERLDGSGDVVETERVDLSD